jgi:hypothetical protein
LFENTAQPEPEGEFNVVEAGSLALHRLRSRPPAPGQLRPQGGPEPAFLISKPFQQSMLSAILSQALFFGRTAKHARRRPA